MVLSYFKHAGEKQRLTTVVKHQQKQRPGEALLFLKVDDAIGAV